MKFGGLYDTIVEKNIPFFGSLEITTACNNNCVHCYNVGSDMMPPEMAKRCLDEAAELGTLFLNITGGEPMLHKDIWDILSYAINLNFATLLYTNATLIGSEEATRLKDMGIYHVDTTLLGARSETHDALTRVKGSFEKTMRAVDLLKTLGVSMAVKTPVMKENADETEDIHQMLSDMGIDHIASPLIFAKDNGDSAPLRHRPSDIQLKRFFLSHEVKSLTDAYGCYSCHFGRCVFAVRANGEVNPCISVPLPLGNVRERSLKEIWTGSSELEYIRRTNLAPLFECRDCDLVNWCFRCEGIPFTEEGKLFVPSSELCRMAKIRMETSHEKKWKYGKEKKVQQAAN